MSTYTAYISIERNHASAGQLGTPGSFLQQTPTVLMLAIILAEQLAQAPALS